MPGAADGSPPPTAAEIEPFVRFNVVAMPFTTAALLVIILVLESLAAARIAEASGPPRASARSPLDGGAAERGAHRLRHAAVLAAFVPGAVGYAAGAVAGAFGGALALIGLAVLHAMTIGNSVRLLILVAVYVLLVFFGGLPLVLFAVLGIAEAFLHLRARRFRGAPPLT